MIRSLIVIRSPIVLLVSLLMTGCNPFDYSRPRVSVIPPDAAKEEALLVAQSLWSVDPFSMNVRDVQGWTVHSRDAEYWLIIEVPENEVANVMSRLTGVNVRSDISVLTLKTEGIVVPKDSRGQTIIGGFATSPTAFSFQSRNRLRVGPIYVAGPIEKTKFVFVSFDS